MDKARLCVYAKEYDTSFELLTQIGLLSWVISSDERSFSNKK